MNFRQQLLEAWPELAGFLNFDLPRFVYGGALASDDIPVFSFHRVTSDQLRPLLEHLHRNRYASVTLDQFVDHLSGARLCPPRSVVLTFDDGWASSWMVATPLLREFGMKATLFVPPALIKDEGSVRPTLDDEISDSEVTMEDSNLESYLVSWPEINAMQSSGVWDIQSHTLTHGCVWNSDQVRDFYHDGSAHDVLTMMPGTVLADDSSREPHQNSLTLGQPLYDDSPRMDVTRRFVPDPMEKRDMEKYVQGRGGPAFFTRPGWKKELLQVLSEFQKIRPGNWETKEACRAAMRDELVEARRIIESKTGRPVRHLLFPWERGNRLAVQIARETGHRTALFGVIRGRRGNRPGDDPFATARLSWKFIRLLPGQGRQRITDNILSRIRHRLRPADGKFTPTTNIRESSK